MQYLWLYYGNNKNETNKKVMISVSQILYSETSPPPSCFWHEINASGTEFEEWTLNLALVSARYILIGKTQDYSCMWPGATD